MTYYVWINHIIDVISDYDIPEEMKTEMLARISAKNVYSFDYIKLLQTISDLLEMVKEGVGR